LNIAQVYPARLRKSKITWLAQIENDEVQRLLGINVDNTLSWTLKVSYIRKKVNMSLNKIDTNALKEIHWLTFEKRCGMTNMRKPRAFRKKPIFLQKKPLKCK